MQNEIKPMSAEEILQDFRPGGDAAYSMLEDYIRHALAAYTKFLLEKVPIGEDVDTPWHDERDYADGRNIALNTCRSLLQDQIDQLTK